MAKQQIKVKRCIEYILRKAATKPAKSNRECDLLSDRNFKNDKIKGSVVNYTKGM